MLQHTALKVSLSISQPGFERKDKSATKIAQEAGNVKDSRMGRYTKDLIDRDKCMLFRRPANILRSSVKFLCLPWNFKGEYVTPAKLWKREMNDISKKKRNLEIAQMDWTNNYPIYKAEAEQVCGSYFNDREYPTQEDIARSFGVTLETGELPVTLPPSVLSVFSDGQDFRIPSEDEMRKIYDEIKKAEQKALNCTVASCAERVATVLAEVTKAIQEKHKGKRATYRDSLLRNVLDLTEILPELNMSNSPDITELYVQLKDDILSDVGIEKGDHVKPAMEYLRRDKDKEKELAEKAKEIHEKASLLIPKPDDDS